MKRLDKKIAIVTGGAHGIGRAISEVFAAEGARVLVVDIDEAAGQAGVSGICETGGEAIFCRADVSSPLEAAAAVKRASQQWDRIDILCNSAAYLGPFHDVLGATEDEWQRSIEVTLLGTYFFIREALPWMVRRRQGSIINIASVQALVGGRDSAAYTTVKSGLLGLTRSVAYDYGPHNIRVNAICPGPIQTRISPQPGEELHQRQVGKTMLGRVGQPRDVACAALFLASDEASYITGVALPVDGGWTAI
ncbi:MAG: SDR family NAD(P)-dependent oxidoreductase [Acidobacteriota bacterium]